MKEAIEQPDPNRDLNNANDTLQAIVELIQRWRAAELNMRVLHGGLPGSGYDKLADGYGTCADELSETLDGHALPDPCPTCGARWSCAHTVDEQ